MQSVLDLPSSRTSTADIVPAESVESGRKTQEFPVFALPPSQRQHKGWALFGLKKAYAFAEHTQRLLRSYDQWFSAGPVDVVQTDTPQFTYIGTWPSQTWSSQTMQAMGALGSACVFGDLTGRSASAYDYRQRLSALASWQGEPYGTKADSITPSALSLAGTIATYAESRIRSLGAVLATVLAPADGRGVHMEWTARNGHVSHLEITVSADRLDRFELLRTEETESGRMLSAFEFADATLEEVIAFFEQVLAKAPRA